ncbi:ATP-binding protein [Paraburkholderia sp. SIMBA_049]
MSAIRSNISIHASSAASENELKGEEKVFNESDRPAYAASAEDVSSHPLFGTVDLIATPQTAEVYGIVKIMVVLNDSGAYISARPGAGKSCCLQILQAYFNRDMPSLPSFILHANQQQHHSIRAFYKGLLFSLGLSTSGETADLRARTFTQLAYLGRESRIRKILFLIDEAHRMGIFEFQFLKDVYNHLSLNGVSLITIMVGQQPNLSERIDKLRADGHEDIIGRFASKEISFRSFETISDIEIVFDAIDLARDSNGKSWTEFFCPVAFSNGFRLSGLSERFFENLQHTMLSPAAPYFDARPFFRAIRYFLVALAGLDGPSIELSDSTFKNAIFSARLDEVSK